jgi:hypothetical protein
MLTGFKLRKISLIKNEAGYYLHPDLYGEPAEKA